MLSKTEAVSRSIEARLAASHACNQFIPLELETRPTVETAAYCFYMHLRPQTARIHACKQTGPIQPIRIPGSAKLHWPTAEIKRVLGVAI